MPGVFVITGASSGIGAATSRLALEAGHRVVLAARSAERLEAHARSLGAGDRVCAVACDVTEWDDVQRLAATALERFGAIDVVLASAGIGGERGFAASSPERWREMIVTNVHGTALTIRATLDAVLRARGHYVIVNSVSGRRGVAGSIYSATKWGQRGLGEALRLEVEGTGVRVTSLEPGTVDTEFFLALPDSAPAIDDQVLTADDVARAVMFAVGQPARVNVNEILMRPTSQAY